MKKLTSFTLLLVMLLGVACAPANKQSINAKDLIGKYEIDFSPLIANDSSDIEDTDLALGMLTLSGLHITFQFGENSMVIDMTGPTANLLKLAVPDLAQLPVATDYQIKNDSILTYQAGGEWEELILHKVGDTYDCLRLRIPDEDNMELLLRKQVAE